MVYEFWWGSSELIKKLRCLAVNAKHRPITHVCPPFLSNWLAALHLPWIYIYYVWSASGIGLLLVNLAQVCCGDTFSNPPANGNQALIISLNIKSVQCGKILKTTLSPFLDLGFYVISTRTRFNSWDSPFKLQILIQEEEDAHPRSISSGDGCWLTPAGGWGGGGGLQDSPSTPRQINFFSNSV